MLFRSPLSSFAKITEITSEQESSITSILEECGISDIKKIEHDEMLDGWNTQTEKGYRVTVENINNVIIYIDNGILSEIRYADNNLYKNGKMIEPLTNFTLTSTEKAQIEINCKDYVKNTLVSPSTAKFAGYGNWDIHKSHGTIYVTSYVDAQNSFGAQIRNNFEIVINDNKVISYKLDGVEMLKQ